MSFPSRNPAPARQAAPARVPEDAHRAAPRAGAGPLFDEPQAQPQPQPEPAGPARPAVTFTISAVLDGFPFSVQFAGAAEQLPATIARLRELGAVPPVLASPAALAAEAAREAPVCKYHGPMKPSAKAPGTYYCSHRMGDGSYCKEKHPA